jgi:hypothetical protein
VGSTLTTRQRRELRDAGKILGGRVSVYAIATGRANARWSPTASWIVGVFGGVFLFVLLALHVIIFPGVLVGLLLYESIRPRRSLAVTNEGVAELRLRTLNGRPEALIAVTDHGALSPVRMGPGPLDVSIGGEAVTLRDRELHRLRVAVASIAAPVSVGGPPLPPPPGGGLPFTPAPRDELPGWREATIGKVLGHLLLGLLLCILFLVTANVIGAALGRDIERTSDAATAWLLWAAFLGAMIGWMLFVYWRGSRRTRLLLLGLIAGGGFVICCVLNVVGSPPMPG